MNEIEKLWQQGVGPLTEANKQLAKDAVLSKSRIQCTSCGAVYYADANRNCESCTRCGKSSCD